MGFLSRVIKKIRDGGISNIVQQVAPAPETQDVVIAYTPEGATANEQLANLQKVTPVQMAAPEGPDPSTYRYYSGNLGEVGFGQVNPALYGEAKMMSYINPVSGQYFNTATPLPEDIVPEGWQALEQGMWPDRAEYIPGLMKGEGKQASMAPASQILAMQRGEAFTQPSAPSTTQTPTSLPPAPGFRPRVLQDMPQDARFMDMIRKYADKDFMPALPTLDLNQLGKPQQYADGGPVLPNMPQDLAMYLQNTGRSFPTPAASAMPTAGAMSTTPGATPGGLIPSSTPITQNQMQTIVSDLTSVPSSTLKPGITPDMTIGQDITPLPGPVDFSLRQRGQVTMAPVRQEGRRYGFDRSQVPVQGAAAAMRALVQRMASEPSGSMRLIREDNQGAQGTSAGSTNKRYGFDRSQTPAQRERFVPQGPSDTGRAELMEFLKKNRMGV